MSFIYSRALVAASSPGKCLDIDACALLSGSPTPQGYSSPDKTTALSRLSRFGMPFRPLTADRGAELLTSWLAGFPAKTSVLQEKAQASPELAAECGATWRASLAKFDLASSSWKTVQLCLLGDSELSSVTWPRSGMTAGGQCWELPMLGRRTSETGFGFLLPTPCASDTGSRAGTTRQFVTSSGTVRRANPDGTTSNIGLAGSVHRWPTPTSTLGTKGGLVTPTKAREGGTLIEALSARTTWPTPTVCGNYNRKGASATSGDGLATVVAKFQTPNTNGMDGGSNSRKATLKRGQEVLSGGALNPTWVEWLMGWPLGWTALKPSETARFPSVPPQHSECLPLSLEAEA